MNVVDVFDKSCGFHTRITSRRENGVMVNLTVSSECEAAVRWGQKIEQVDWRQCLGRDFQQSHLWKSAMETLQHLSCPLPIATLRAIEAEIGVARAADIRIRFLALEADADQKAQHQPAEDQ